VSANGPHSELRLTLRGLITADDPRLTGVLETNVKIMVNNASSYGTGRGTFAIRDPATREKEVEGTLFSVESPFGPHGFMIGKIRQPRDDDEDESRSNFLANFSASSTGEGMIEGELGATSDDDQTPAVIQSGHCEGRFLPLRQSSRASPRRAATHAALRQLRRVLRDAVALGPQSDRLLLLWKGSSEPVSAAFHPTRARRRSCRAPAAHSSFPR
jgi:hypothetical protein